MFLLHQNTARLLTLKSRLGIPEAHQIFAYLKKLGGIPSNAEFLINFVWLGGHGNIQQDVII